MTRLHPHVLLDDGVDWCTLSLNTNRPKNTSPMWWPFSLSKKPSLYTFLPGKTPRQITTTTTTTRGMEDVKDVSQPS